MIEETQDLFQLMLEQFQEKKLGAPGEAPAPSALDMMDADLGSQEEKMAARKGIQYFVAASRDWLQDHPPQGQAMLSQGIGITFAGGYEASIGPMPYTQAGQLEESPTYHVTMGHSIRGQHGITEVTGIPVTHGKVTQLRDPGE